MIFLAREQVQAEPPTLAVSSFELDTLTLKPPTAKELAAALNTQGDVPWCQAKPVESDKAWNELPKGADRVQWVSFVTVGFNEQADAYAFMFDGPEGAMSLAAHLPFRQTWLPAGVLAWIWPMPGMLGTLHVHHDALAKPIKREPLALKIVPWPGADTEVVKSTTRNSGSSLDEARTLDPELVFAPVAVMAHAAAFEAGWAPTPGKTDWTAVCEVRVEDRSCSFRLKLSGPCGEETFVKEQVPWETYHDHLVRIFRFAQSKSGVSDMIQLTRGTAEVLAVEEGRLACLLDKELAVFDLNSGKKLWTTEPAVKGPTYRPIDQYAVRRDGQGKWQLLRYCRQLSELDWATGAATPLALVHADGPTRFATDGGSLWAGIAGASLQAGNSKQLAWEQKQLDPFTAGPAFYGSLIFAGDGSGNLFAYATSDGAIRWQQQLPARLYGSIVVDEDRLLVFSNEAESLLALDSATGKELWRTPVGDVLQQAPILVGQHLLLVTKSNKLLLVDRTKGTVKQEATWPTWFVAVEAVTSGSDPKLACTDLAGDLTILSLADFKPLRKISLGMELTGPVVHVPEMPLRWPVLKADADDENLLTEIKEGPVPKGPAWLVTDSTGFLYILPQATKD